MTADHDGAASEASLCASVFSSQSGIVEGTIVMSMVGAVR